MHILNRFLKYSKILFLENIYTRKIPIVLDKPIFSFTFDDAPLSALTAGSRILEDHEIRGTYYIAMGIKNDIASKNTEPFIQADQVRDLHHKGHHIACHTYSHINLRKTKISDALADCEKNVQVLSGLLGGISIEHFSYPFGMVSPKAKKLLGQRYQTLRTTDFGINYGNTDLTHLRSISVYSRNFNKSLLRNVINETIKHNAWTIFYTHDIRNSPSKWGASINDFSWIVDACIKTGADVFNIQEAYTKIMHE